MSPASESQTEKQVFIIDDDPGMRIWLTSLFSSVGLPATAFNSTAEFREASKSDVPTCLVLDVHLPGTSGLDFQAELAKAKSLLPIIFITGRGDISMSVRAMKAGAVEFLTKPFRDQDLLDAVRFGLDLDSTRRDRDRMLAKVRSAYETLTPREKQVFPLVATGLMNKQIAATLGVSEITVKVHRGNVMRKMGART